MSSTYFLTPVLLRPLILSALVVAGCDALFTSPPDDADVMDGPLPGLTPDELRAFVAGDEAFEQAFAPADGLGPIFNEVSCARCHSGDGRGHIRNVLTRISIGSDPVLALGGPQIQTRAIPGAVAEVLPDGVDVSLRLPPPVFGVGLIEAIPVDAILANADPTDQDGNGISGRPNWVGSPEWVPTTEVGSGPGPQLGRFGRKGQVSSLLEQVAVAYHQDMGITTDFIPIENRNPQVASAGDNVADPELSATVVDAVVQYVRMLAPPAAGIDNPDRVAGRQIFESIGCADCHVPSFTTGSSPVSAIAGVEVTLYSDLLLHDMGDALADNRPDGSANGREWRTAPLWGLRVVPDFLNGEWFLMHDGRARSVEEAIVLHGGEALAARQSFTGLTASDRQALLAFVSSR